MNTARWVLGRSLQITGLFVVGRTLYQALVVGNMGMTPELMGALLGFGIFYTGHYLLTLGET
jgi:hypothetical protein